MSTISPEEEHERRISSMRFLAREKRIEQDMKEARSGRFERIESPERVAKYRRREQMHARAGKPQLLRAAIKPAAAGLERSLGLGGELLSIEFFEQGLIAARSIGRIVTRFSEHGTGFLVGEDLLMTNHHVLPDALTATRSVFELDYENNNFGARKEVQHFEFDPVSFFLTLPELDVSLVALRTTSEEGRPLSEFGFHPLVVEEGKILKGKPVNIIQHPDGHEKAVVVHDSRFLDYDAGGEADHLCWYSSDTERGSSGSPVFNNRWEVVALHHRSVPKMSPAGEYLDVDGKVIPREKVDANQGLIVWVANEGVRVSRLVPGIESAPLQPEFVERRRRLLELWKQIPARVALAAAGEPRAPQPVDLPQESLHVVLEAGTEQVKKIPASGGRPGITIRITFD